MAKRRTVLECMDDVVDDTTTFDLVSNQMKRGQLFCLQLVSYRNETSKKGHLHVGIRRAGADYWIYSQDQPATAKWYNIKPNIYIPSPCQVIVRFQGADVGDKVHARVFGYLTDFDGG